jgi:UDP-hydrolysing UDP-N-acetyl-D-glucosamine 2-epimerase
MRKICVVTGSRAEYGLMHRLMKMIKTDAETKLQIIVTNMHLQPEFGNTYQEIENDGFTIDKKVYMNSSGDSPFDTVQSMSEEMKGMNQAFEDLKPELLVVFGDRYEMLVAATVAMIHKIPIAHIGGGIVTSGAYDDNIRHSITKMSHLHFTSTENHRNRVIQLGESPKNVYAVGSLGVENIKKMQLLNKEDLEQRLNFNIDKKTVLATYHPETLSQRNTEDDIDSFLSALDERPEIRIIFTMPNSDVGNSIISKKINQFVALYPNRAKAFSSLGKLVYLSLMQYAAAVIGNSSSGLVEAPSFGIPTLNIGDRQKGREMSSSVVNCSVDKQSILKGLDNIFNDYVIERAKKIQNPYEKNDTAQTIFNVIKTHPLDNILQKQFYHM